MHIISFVWFSLKVYLLLLCNVQHFPLFRPKSLISSAFGHHRKRTNEVPFKVMIDKISEYHLFPRSEYIFHSAEIFMHSWLSFQMPLRGESVQVAYLYRKRREDYCLTIRARTLLGECSKWLLWLLLSLPWGRNSVTSLRMCREWLLGQLIVLLLSMEECR